MPDVSDQLARALATTRTGAGAGELARRIVDAQPHLVGLTADGERIVYWSNSARDIQSAPIDDTGVDGLATDRLERARTLRQVEQWLRGRWDSFAWIHPRWRWIHQES